MKVGYQGIKGAYSEEALYKHFGKNVEAIGFETFEEVFEAVRKGDVGFGILPFENTITGSIVMNYDLILKEEMYIIAEILLNIKHYLLSHKSNKTGNIKKAYSHPVALDQCREFLKKHNIRGIPEYDTAGAAKMIKERNKDDEAAIASDICSDIYDLEILEREIETNKANLTKFFVIVNNDKIPTDLKKEKTSIAFKTKHYPGALVNCLERLSKNNVNLTKLESRPIAENPWEYVFYAELDGGVDDDNVKLSLKEIEAATLFLKVLGSYPKAIRK